LLIGVIGGATLGLLSLLLQRHFTSSSPPSLPQTPELWTPEEGPSDTRFKASPDGIQENGPEEG
jgi:hypothetical protein